MAKQVKIRRGSSSSQTGFIGVEGEVTYNTDTKRLISHDGSKAGGFSAIHEDGDNGINLTLTGQCTIQASGFQLKDSVGNSRISIQSQPGIGNQFSINDTNNVERIGFNNSSLTISDSSSNSRFFISNALTTISDQNGNSRILITNNGTIINNENNTKAFWAIRSGTFIYDGNNVERYISSGQFNIIYDSGHNKRFQANNNQTSLYDQNGIERVVINQSGISGYTRIVPALTPANNSTITIDWTSGNLFRYNLQANTNINFVNNKDGQSIVIGLSNTGSHTFSGIWPTSLHWPSGAIPRQTPSGKIDIYTVINLGTGLYANVVQNFYN